LMLAMAPLAKPTTSSSETTTTNEYDSI
jgi:hypothetical protein